MSPPPGPLPRAGGGVSAALREAVQRLAPTSDTPRLDAELLLAHALGISRDTLLLDGDRFSVPETFAPLLDRRIAGEPLAYITGTRDFWTLTLAVTPAVLIPRPDSETLIEAAVDHFRGSAPATVLDLGTGSGALLLAALDQWKQAIGLGIDASAEALAVAEGNAVRCGLADRATFRFGDWTTGLTAPFDLILCNPPYIKVSADLPPDVRNHEPHSALFAGTDGLDDYRRLAPAIGPLLSAGGFAAIEIGHDQGESAAALFRDAGLSVTVRRDLAGHPRCLCITA